MRRAVLAAAAWAVALACPVEAPAAGDLVAFNEVSFPKETGGTFVRVDGTTSLPDGVVLTLLLRCDERTVPGVGAYLRAKRGRVRGQAGPIEQALAPGLYHVDLRFVADDQDPALIYDLAGIPDQASSYEVRVGSIDDLANLEKSYRGMLEASIASIEAKVEEVRQLVADVRARRRYLGEGGLDVPGLVAWVRAWDEKTIEALEPMREEARKYALPFMPEFTEPLSRANESMHYIAAYWVGKLCEEAKATPPAEIGLGGFAVPPEVYEKDFLSSLQPMKDWLHPPEEK